MPRTDFPRPSHRCTFSYEEALDLFPHVRDLTTVAHRRLGMLVNVLTSHDELDRRREELESAAQAIVEEWAAEVGSYGGEVKGLWLVDWDSGDGYYCWKFPEDSLGHFHGYDEGFSGRVPIA